MSTALLMDFKPFSTVGKEERDAVDRVLRSYPLSGFLGGNPRGGYFVQKLEAEWCEAFGVRHAIACNSATSGLLAACKAVGVDAFTHVSCPAYTMSATAAAPRMLHSGIHFCDIDSETFCGEMKASATTVAIITNLFGHPARGATVLRKRADEGKALWVIEDNAQAPFAMEDGRYAGTIGHIGVFSLNVHKQIQAGEGGVICTDSHDLANSCRAFINHGEMAARPRVGLNLRMTEVTAAIASEQLKKGPGIIASRIEQAEFLTDCVKDYPFLRAPIVRPGCKHVYYIWAALVSGIQASFIASSLARAGLPVRGGYVNPLYNLPAFGRYKRPCPVTEDVESRIITFENCAITIMPDQEQAVRDIFRQVAEAADKMMSGAFA
jgi:perosamine synthetase